MKTSSKRTVSGLLVGAALIVPVGNAWGAALAARPATHVFAGPSVDMRWGPVQVQLVVKGKTIIDVRSSYPTERARSAYINEQAIPMLRSQVLKQQGIKNVYAIGGATMTSEAYGQSLQAALNQAHL
jgi:uncharacterized protein with FMN-binding domain